MGSCKPGWLGNDPAAQKHLTHADPYLGPDGALWDCRAVDTTQRGDIVRLVRSDRRNVLRNVPLPRFEKEYQRQEARS